MSQRIYAGMTQHSQCQLCGKSDDLRFGTCLDCASFVEGERISPMMLRIWDMRDPTNTWLVQTLASI